MNVQYICGYNLLVVFSYLIRQNQRFSFHFHYSFRFNTRKRSTKDNFSYFCSSSSSSIKNLLLNFVVGRLMYTSYEILHRVISALLFFFIFRVVLSRVSLWISSVSIFLLLLLLWEIFFRHFCFLLQFI